MLPRLRSVPGPQATMLPRLRSVPGPLSHLLGGHLGPALRLEVLLLHRCGSERVETLARSALLWRLPVASHRLLPVYELLPALNVLNGLPVILDLALGLGEDLLQLVHLALQLGLKGELHVVECEGARGQLIHGCNTALASWKQGGVGGEGPEASHHCNCLVFNILDTADVDSAGINRDETTHRENLLSWLSIFSDVLFENLDVVSVEKDVDLLVVLVLVLSNTHVVGKISSDLALNPYKGGAEEHLPPEVEHEALPVLFQLLLVLLLLDLLQQVLWSLPGPDSDGLMDEAVLAQLLVLGALVRPVEELDLGAGHQLGPRLPCLELLTVDPHGFEVEENQTIFL